VNKPVLARRLKEARIRKGLTQEALGVLAGIDEFSASARMNQYEQGKHSPHYQTVSRLAEVLGVSVAYFYADNEQDADLLLMFSQLMQDQRTAVIEFVRSVRPD
jgi:transcriptional regulator with XRE-family HTH domain